MMAALVISLWRMMAVRALVWHGAVFSLPFLTSVSMPYVLYMLNVQFDYGLHVKVNAPIFALFLVVWFVWWSNQPARKRTWHIPCFVAGSVAASLCELLWSGPPLYRTLDGHATWHLLGIPCSWIWWRFVMTLEAPFKDVSETTAR